MRQLEGTTALVTGASSGLGPVIARRLHREGVRTVLSARRRPELEALARELVGSRVVTADLAQRGEPERLAAEAGEVDVLVANAGVPASGRLATFDVAELDRALDVNVRAPMVLARLLLTGMIERRRGHIVLMASMAGQVATAKLSVYSATKAALRSFGHALHDELRGAGVGVTVVSPFYVSQAGVWAETGQRMPLGEVNPGQVAEAVVRGIRRNLAEITVAPLPVRAAARLPMAFPQLLHAPFVASVGGMPDEAIESQLRKR